MNILSVSFMDMLDLSSYLYFFFKYIMNYYYSMKDLINANVSILNNSLIKINFLNKYSLLLPWLIGTAHDHDM